MREVNTDPRRTYKYVIGVVVLLVAGIGLIGGLLAVRGDGARGLPVYRRAPELALVDQYGDTLRTADLRGTVWVAGFIFTNCTGVCPLISAKMARVRDALAAEGLLGTDARLVSITVDPARDTPEVLRAYAENFGGSPPAEWAFLTGSPPEAVRAMIQEGFRLGAVVLPGASTDTVSGYQVRHSPRIVLVDRRGRTRGFYSAAEPGTVERVMDDLRELVQGKG